MSLKIQNWTAPFREHLTLNYEYNRESGYVTKRFRAAKGPKQAGSLGTVTKSNDLLLTIWFEEKAYSVRLHRLAVLLETGLLYDKVIHKDGNKLNNKWDNLVPVGNPLDVDGNFVELTEEQQAIAVAEHKAAKLAAAEQKDWEIMRTKEDIEISKQKIIEEKLRAKGKASEEKKKDDGIDWYARGQEAIREEQEKRLAFVRGPLKPFLLLREKYEKRLATYRYKKGLCTKMELVDRVRFESDCAKQGIADLVRFYNENKENFDPSKHEKWEVDAFNLGKWKYLERAGLAIVEPKLAVYMWEGKEVIHEYDELSVEDTIEYKRELAELELEMGTTEQQLEDAYNEPVEQKIKEIVETGAILSEVAAQQVFTAPSDGLYNVNGKEVLAKAGDELGRI